ncbi:MAG: hypothetical protein ABIS18_09365, partial [Actinomycetota bacterium]
MRLVTFRSETSSASRPGAIVDLESGPHVADLVGIRSIEWLIGAGSHALSVCRDLVANTHARTMTPLAAVQLLAPITRPNSIRDFIAFEDHA